MSGAQDYLFKVVVVGDAGVGKTSLIKRYVDRSFSTPPPTVGMDFRNCLLPVSGHIVKLQIWDTAGSERFRTIVAAYYRGAVAAIVVFDMTSLPSFDNVVHWFSEIEPLVKPSTLRVLVGAKGDLPAAVDESAVRAFADSIGVRFVVTSAKNGTNVDETFELVARGVLMGMTVPEGREGAVRLPVAVGPTQPGILRRC